MRHIPVCVFTGVMLWGSLLIFDKGEAPIRREAGRLAVTVLDAENESADSSTNRAACQ